MPLTEVACRNAKRADQPYKLYDASGLYLLVAPSGSRLWRLKYRFAGHEKKLALGTYPLVSLKQARERRDEARLAVQQGRDPAAERREAKVRAAAASLNSFEAVARAWHAAKAPMLKPRYAGQILDRLQADVFPAIGRMPIEQVGPPQVLALIRTIEARGSLEMSHRVRMHVSDVFVWAIASGLCEADPAATIRKALVPTDPRLRPAVTKLAEARAVLERTEALTGTWRSTRLASRLLALTAARPGVIRLAEHQEFEELDGTAPLWRIPAEKMKLTRERRRDAAFEFVVPLSRQAADLVRVAAASSLACRAGEHRHWLFPGVAGWRKPISDSTLSCHYRDAGFTGAHVPHGWRATFSTIMNERAATQDRERDRAIIDLMLAHVPEGVEAAYNRAAYMPRRRELAQAWADMLVDGLKAPSDLVVATEPARERRDSRRDAPD